MRRLYQITSNYYCCGIEVKDGVIVNAAPIVGWSMGKKIEDVLKYWNKKKITVYRYEGMK